MILLFWVCLFALFDLFWGCIIVIDLICMLELWAVFYSWFTCFAVVFTFCCVCGFD